MIDASHLEDVVDAEVDVPSDREGLAIIFLLSKMTPDKRAIELAFRIDDEIALKLGSAPSARLRTGDGREQAN